MKMLFFKIIFFALLGLGTSSADDGKKEQEESSFKDSKTNVGFQCTLAQLKEVKSTQKVVEEEISYIQKSLVALIAEIASLEKSLLTADSSTALSIRTDLANAMNEKAEMVEKISKLEIRKKEVDLQVSYFTNSSKSCNQGINWLAAATYAYQAAKMAETEVTKVYAGKVQDSVNNAKNTNKDMTLVAYDTSINTASQGQKANERQASYAGAVTATFGTIYGSWSRFQKDKDVATNIKGLYSIATAYGVDSANFIRQANAYKSQKHLSEGYRNDYLALQTDKPGAVDCNLVPTDPSCSSGKTSTSSTSSGGWGDGGNYNFPGGSDPTTTEKDKKTSNTKAHIPGTATALTNDSSGNPFEDTGSGAATVGSSPNVGASGKSLSTISAGALKGWGAEDRKKQQAKDGSKNSEYTAEYSKRKKKAAADAASASAARQAKVANPFEKLFGAEGEAQEDDNVGIRVIAGEEEDDSFDSNIFERISQAYSRKWQNDELRVYNLLDSK